MTPQTSLFRVGRRFLTLVLTSLSVVTCHDGGAAGSSAPVRLSGAPAIIVDPVDDTLRVTIGGNTRPEARAENDLGRVDDDLPLHSMLLLLKRSPEQDRALDELMDEQIRPGAANYHKWLTAEDFGRRFGLADEDLASVTGWLTKHGFTVNGVTSGRTMVDFSGSAGSVREAFHTEIHALSVKGVRHIANMSDPQIPMALSPAVAGVVSLHDFRPHTDLKPRADYTFVENSSTYYGLVPGDLATIYNLNPLFTAGVTGTGQTVAVIEDTNVLNTSDWSTFRSTFGLSTYTSGSFSQVQPAGSLTCTAPGVNGAEGEALIDAEWATAAAPSATIKLASCADTTTTFGGLIALENLLGETTPPGIVSISYGECEADNGATANASYNTTYKQAASQGISVFVSSGDQGAASCDADDNNGNPYRATHGIGISGFTSTPYNVSVGGTDFSDSYSGTNATYWNGTNTATYASALSYVPEIPWNDSCASVLASSFSSFAEPWGTAGFCNSSTGEADYLSIGAGSGGPSGCASGTPGTGGVVGGSCAGWAKPSWQSLVGVPSDGVRDIPDVSLFAANGVWGHFYVYCNSDTNQGGAACTGAPSGWSGAGGTSFASPIMAGIQALVNEQNGLQGNPAPVYYAMANTEYGATGSASCNSSKGNTIGSSCIFNDVTLGDMDVDCTGTHDCYLPSGTYGVLSTSNTADALAYGTQTGWDFATGIGTVNAYNLVENWPGVTTTTTLAANPTAAVVGTSVALTATVQALRAYPVLNGTVTFYNGTSSLGVGTFTTGTTAGLQSATATLNTTTLPVGANSITAKYTGDTKYGNSTSAAVIVTIYSQVTVTPNTTQAVLVGATIPYVASGGSGSYAWSVPTNPSVGNVTGCTTSASCTFNAGATGGVVDTVQVADTALATNKATDTVDVDKPLTLTPTSATIAQGDGYTGFVAAGGISTDTWSIAPASTGLVINTATGAITTTASTTVRSYTVTVTDSASHTATATLIVNAALALSPSSATIAQGDTSAAYTTTGGVGTVTLTVQTATGLSISGGAVTATTATPPGNYTVTATDSLNNKATATIVVNAALAIAPTTQTIAQGDTSPAFTTTGGVGTVTWSIQSAAGLSISAGAVTATTATPTASYTVTATDSLNNKATATIVVNAPLAVAPTTQTIAQGDTSPAFTTTGGAGTIKWSIQTAAGLSITAGAVTATAATPTGSYTVTATDALNNTATATIVVNAALVVTPTTLTIARGDTSAPFTTSGGVGAVTWTIQSAAGLSISGGAVTATAATPTGSYTVTATDSLNNKATATLVVNAALAVAPTTQTIAQGDTSPAFTTTGGVGTITWSVQSAAGLTINAGAVTATAATPVASYTVTATDSLSNTATATIVVNAALAMAPSTQTIAQGDTSPAFTTTGGVGTITWSIQSAAGLTVLAGAVTATVATPPASYTVTATDSLNNKATATIVVEAALAVAPATRTIAQGDTSAAFTTTGGVGTVTWTIQPAVGLSISAGAVTATTSTPPASYTVTATDSLNNKATATIVVNAALAIAPFTQTIAQGDTSPAFTTSGGVGTVAWSIQSAAGLTVSGGAVTATVATPPASYTVTATDALNNTATATVVVNAALVVSPATQTIAQGDTSPAFTTTGGVGTVTLTVQPAAGLSISGGAVKATAGTPPASYTVTATDSLNNKATATIVVNAALAVAPSTQTIAQGDTSTAFTTTGGVGTVTWTIQSAVGLSISGGAVTATTSTPPASYTVTATDALNNTATASIVVNAALAMAPSTQTIAQGDTSSAFTTTGGVGAVTWSIQAAPGLSVTGGAVKATPATPPASYTVTATDTLNNKATATIIVNAALAVTPSTQTIAQGDTSPAFATTGGVGTVAWTIQSANGLSVNGGAVTATTATPPASYTVTATDSLNNSATATIVVNAALVVAPSTQTIAQTDSSPAFTTTGGVGTITWTVQSAAGLSVNAGIVTATISTPPASYTVTATDSLNNSATGTIVVNAALSLAPSTQTIAQGDTSPVFAPSGGVGTVTLTIQTAAGLSISGGAVTATTSTPPASYAVIATDSLNNKAFAIIVVDPALAVAPGAQTIAQGDMSAAFTTTGGVGSVTWSVQSAAGLGVNAGVVTTSAATPTGSYNVKATDALGNVAMAVVVVNAALTVAPPTATIAQGDVYSGFAAMGGVGTDSWSILPTEPGVTIDPAAGTVTTTAAAPAQSYAVTVTDTLLNTSTATLVVNPALALAPATATIAQGDQYSGFSTTGGVGTPTWTIAPAGAGVTISSSGVVSATATATIGGYTVTATDSLSNTATATLTLNAGISLSPSMNTLAQGDIYTGFAAAGGVGSYTWTVTPASSGVSVSSAGLVTAGATASVGSYTITVADTLSNKATATVVVVAAIALSPPSVTIAQGDTYSSFAVTGGVGADSWNIGPVGQGVTISMMGAVTAATTATTGSYTATVTDTLSNNAMATVIVNAALAISPTVLTIASGDTDTFSATGGVGAYTWTVTSTTGSSLADACQGSPSCVYTAGAVGDDTVTVTDAVGHTSSATVTINPALAIDPSTKTVETNATITFAASGGVGAYGWVINAGSGGSLAASCSGNATCLYTAGPLGASTDKITLSDAHGNSVEATVTVDPGLKLAPATATVLAGKTFSFAATGGVGVYSWALTPNLSGATLSASCQNSATCVYTAGSTSGVNDTLVVADGNADTITAVVTVDPDLAITPDDSSVSTGADVQFAATGGSGSGYRWSFAATDTTPDGTITTGGAYVAGASAGSDTVQVTDSAGNTWTTTITITAKVTPDAGSPGTDAGPQPAVDGGSTTHGGADAGTPAKTTPGGCGCGTGSDTITVFGFVVLLGMMRRRKIAAQA